MDAELPYRLDSIMKTISYPCTLLNTCSLHKSYFFEWVVDVEIEIGTRLYATRIDGSIVTLDHSETIIKNYIPYFNKIRFRNEQNIFNFKRYLIILYVISTTKIVASHRYSRLNIFDVGIAFDSHFSQMHRNVLDLLRTYHNIYPFFALSPLVQVQFIHDLGDLALAAWLSFEPPYLVAVN